VKINKINRTELQLDIHAVKKRWNVCNLHQYNPFFWDIENKRMVIDPTWFNTFTEEYKKKIIEQFETISFEPVTVPHEHKQTDETIWLYTVFNNMYDYHIWYKQNMSGGPDGVKMVRLDSKMKKYLASISRRRVLTGRKINESEWEDLEILIAAINIMIKPESKYFVRLSCSSPKHDFNIEPVSRTEDILDYITKSQKYLNMEYIVDKLTYLIIVPWNDHMSKRHEFRLFMKDRKLTAVSQQEWSSYFGYTDTELATIVESLNNISFLNELPYCNAVVDVWIDIVNKKCCLIKCNPYGLSSSSESRLFHWVNDKDIILGKAPIELRICG
jgi:hypothetical protein